MINNDVRRLTGKISPGFTLVEMLVGMFVMVFLIAMTAGFIYYISQSFDLSFEEVRSLDQAQAGVNKIVKELREARDGEDGSYPLVVLGDQELMFYSDIDGDFLTERVRYYVDENRLMRGVLEAVGLPPSYQGTEEIKMVSEGIVNEEEIFSYYNGDWPGDEVNNPLPMADRLLETRYVVVTLEVDIVDDFAADKVVLSGGTAIRNLKDNL